MSGGIPYCKPKVSLDETTKKRTVGFMPQTDQDFKNFSAAVRQLRMRQKLTPHQVATACNISYKHYFNIEQGESRPSIEVYFSICRALGIVKIPLVGA